MYLTRLVSVFLCGKTDDETTTWTTDGGGVDGGDEWVWWG